MSAGYLNPFRTVDSLSPAVWQTPDFGCLGTREVTASTTTTTVDADGNTVVGEPVVNSVVNPSWSRDCMVNATVKNSAWNGLANGYIDLGTYAGITPYVGAGLGVLYTRTKISSEAICEANSTSQTLSTGSESTTTTSTFLCRGQSSPSDAAVTYTPASYRKSNYNFMYSLAAGLSYQVSKNTSLDFGYQYIDAPDVKYYSVSADGIERHKGISTNQFKIGVRYDLW
jgi:opacity protein-like surface antigen